MVGGPVPQKAGRPNHGKKSAPLSQTYYIPTKPTIASRRVAILVADGYNARQVKAIQSALKASRAFPFVIGARRSAIYADGEDQSSSEGLLPAHHFEGMRSTMFDSVFIPSGSHVATLRKQGRVTHWVREAFGHCKAIGAIGEAVDLVRDACELEKMRFAQPESTAVVNSYGVVTAGAIEPENLKESVEITKGSKDFLTEYFYSISCHKHYEREVDGLAEMVAY